MKTNVAAITLASILAASLSGGALAHVDTSEAGSLHWLDHVRETPSTPATFQAEQASQKNWDRDVGNHVEGVGGHALHEAQKMKTATEEQVAQKRENEKSLDRGQNNHEEGVGGHGLHEALHGR